MNQKTIIATLLIISSVLVESGLRRRNTPSSRNVVEVEEYVEDPEDSTEQDPENQEDYGPTRETKVDVNQIYFDCININSEVDKMTTNFTLVSNESCNTVYRFSAFHVIYGVLFKNGTTAEMKIKLELQNAELTPEKTVVTLTGKVIDGYLSGALFQNVVTYPPLNDPNICAGEPGLTELQSQSASVTFIFLPTGSTTENPDSLLSRSLEKLPEAFDCFGNSSINYTPGLLYL